MHFSEEDQEDWGKTFDDQGSEYWEDFLGGPSDRDIEEIYYIDEDNQNDDEEESYTDEVTLNPADALSKGNVFSGFTRFNGAYKAPLDKWEALDIPLRKYIFIDLDGTLVDSAKPEFKKMKDGILDVEFEKICVFPGAKDFIDKAKSLGYECLVISDSHPRYVSQVVKHFFDGLPFLPLADKPNTRKVISFLRDSKIDLSNSSAFLIGDTWLDIELGRGLQIPTILTFFYKSERLDSRDGIGDYRKNIKSGPTYFARSFDKILKILQQPMTHLLPLEAQFKGEISYYARNPVRENFAHDINNEKKVTAYRVLSRQAQGECDEYHLTHVYHEFNRANRSAETLGVIRDSLSYYLNYVLKSNDFSWDFITYVPDKKSTQPPNKMKELFYALAEANKASENRINFVDLFSWGDVDLSIRKHPTVETRKAFVRDNLSLTTTDYTLIKKNVIVIDDQLTTGATAQVVAEKLRHAGVENVLFIALFHLVSQVNSNKLCPKCLASNIEKKLLLKIRRDSGGKFYSCTEPKYGGNGCGYTENLV